MIEPHVRQAIETQIGLLIQDEGSELNRLRKIVSALKDEVRSIQPRSATAISLVGTDGGNNSIAYNPFLVQLVRVVDSSNNELLLDAVTPRTPTADLNAKHITSSGEPLTALGRMMVAVGTRSLEETCTIFANEDGRSDSWVQEYRGIAEWAALLDLVRSRDYGSDTLIVRDGPLREKMFRKGVFRRFIDVLEKGIEDTYSRSRRRVFVVGVVKHSKVLQKFRLAMALEGILRTRYPSYAPVLESLQKEAFRYREWSSNSSSSSEYFVAGEMFMVKFGKSLHDPIWIVDVLSSQLDQAPKILGYLQKDAQHGFPVPYYPQCLQRAHEAAALVDFDLDILELGIQKAMKRSLGSQSRIVDELAIQEADISQNRY